MIYRVKYTMHQFGEIKGEDVIAKSKAEAYDKAVYKAIPEREKAMPYSAWVSSVTYQNGNYMEFNTHEGKPY